MKKQLENHIKLDTSTIIIDKDFYNKVDYICNVISDVEWSGVLFYTLEGDISDLKNVKFHLKDILPMDKGTAVTTDYTLGEDYVNYLMDDPKRLDWLTGQIHSHHSMGTSFSGTDMEELEDNASAHNFYLSLIVNNRHEYTAKIAIEGSTDVEEKEFEYYGTKSNGEKYLISSKHLKTKRKQLYIGKCDIKMPEIKEKVSDNFIKRVAKIVNKVKSYVKSSVPYIEGSTSFILNDPIETVEETVLLALFTGTTDPKARGIFKEEYYKFIKIYSPHDQQKLIKVMLENYEVYAENLTDIEDEIDLENLTIDIIEYLERFEEQEGNLVSSLHVLIENLKNSLKIHNYEYRK